MCSQIFRPVGTNLKLVRRVRGNNLLSMKAERAERLTAWGPRAHLRAPGGVQGPAQGPLVGSRGRAPAGVQGAAPPEAPGFLSFVKGPERLSWKYFFSLNQPTSVVQKCFN